MAQSYKLFECNATIGFKLYIATLLASMIREREMVTDTHTFTFNLKRNVIPAIFLHMKVKNNSHSLICTDSKIKKIRNEPILSVLARAYCDLNSICLHRWQNNTTKNLHAKPNQRMKQKHKKITYHTWK